MIQLLEKQFKYSLIDPIIFRDQDLMASRYGPPGSSRWLRLVTTSTGPLYEKWQVTRNDRSLSESAIRFDVPAHQTTETIADGESQSCSLGLLRMLWKSVLLREAFKYPGQEI